MASKQSNSGRSGKFKGVIARLFGRFRRKDDARQSDLDDDLEAIFENHLSQADEDDEESVSSSSPLLLAAPSSSKTDSEIFFPEGGNELYIDLEGSEDDGTEGKYLDQNAESGSGVEPKYLPVLYKTDSGSSCDQSSSYAASQTGAKLYVRSDGTEMPRHRFGEYVLNKGLISLQALEAASREQEVTGDRIGQILVSNGFLSDRDRISAILEVSSERISQESVTRSRIPSDVLDTHSIIISAETDERIYVSTMEDERVVEHIVSMHYPDKEIEFVSFHPSAMAPFITKMKKSDGPGSRTSSKETMLDRILYRALNDGASDIHILPRAKSYTAMFRILGVRRIIHEGPLDEYRTMIAQVKDRSRMDLAERRQPQDGGFQIEYGGKMIDLRVATLPGSHGEFCVLRVLDPDRVQPNLEDLGITRLDKWNKGFNQQAGLCLICGPTGSGKTTTLNATIRKMDRFGKSIYTIEDPVEYRIPYTGQVSVNTSVGLNFPNAIRAFMRADPDVMVLGEVRDDETARNAIKAADTGHLVLATLHTGSIMGAVSRLRDLGVAPHELRYLLRAVLVQSLVRTVCEDCHNEDPARRSCDSCHGTGYDGRTVISECEYFEDYDAVDRIIDPSLSGDSWTWETMMDDAIDKCRKGVTDKAELQRVMGAAIDPYLGELS